MKLLEKRHIDCYHLSDNCRLPFAIGRHNRQRNQIMPEDSDMATSNTNHKRPRSWSTLAASSGVFATNLFELIELASDALAIQKKCGVSPAIIATQQDNVARMRRDHRNAILCNLGSRAAVADKLPGDFSTVSALGQRLDDATRAGAVVLQFVRAAQAATTVTAFSRIDQSLVHDARITSQILFCEARQKFQQDCSVPYQSNTPSPRAIMAVVKEDVPQLPPALEKFIGHMLKSVAPAR
jgi:hypothetical protein